MSPDFRAIPNSSGGFDLFETDLGSGYIGAAYIALAALALNAAVSFSENVIKHYTRSGLLFATLVILSVIFLALDLARNEKISSLFIFLAFTTGRILFYAVVTVFCLFILSLVTALLRWFFIS